MSAELLQEDRTALEAIVHRMESAWNAGDGAAFAAPFAEDADFVNVRGDHMKGKSVIAQGHDGIFRTIYAGSVNSYTIESARLLRPDVALVHVDAALKVPQGPLAGEHAACFSMVLLKNAGEWEIASFHNTMKAAPRPA